MTTARNAALTAGTLRGLTWDHPRGFRGLDAATAEYLEGRPGLTIEWDRQPLSGFESHPVAELAERYDLLILDHPALGDAARAGCLVPLDEWAADLRLIDLRTDVVGGSLDTYRYEGRLWALPIDAACQAAVFRTDNRLGLDLETAPRTFEDVRRLARRASICVGLKGVHAFLVFFALCANLGEPPGESDGDFVSARVGLRALEILRELYGFCPKEAVAWNSVQALQAMTERPELAYCPYVFSFASYSRRDAPVHLTYTRIPGVDADSCAGAVIGGTGIAISRRSRDRLEEAVRFCAYVLESDVQRSMAIRWGQPSRRSVWLDDEVNDAFGGFYRNTLETLERAVVRPRFPGYIRFQHEAGQLVEAYLRDRSSPVGALTRLDELFQRARAAG